MNSNQESDNPNAQPQHKTGDAAPSPQESWIRSFLKGLCGISLTSVLATIGTVALAFLIFASVITPVYVSTVPAGFIAAKPNDNYAVATLTAMRARLEPTDVPRVVILGASFAHEAIAGQGQLLRENVEEKLERSVRVYDLTAASQLLGEAAFLADYVGSDGFDGVIVIHLNAWSIARGQAHMQELAKQPRLGVTSETWQEELTYAGASPPRTTGVHLIDNAGFYAARFWPIVKNVANKPTEIEANEYFKIGVVPEDWWTRFTPRYREELAEYFEPNVDYSLAVLSRIVDRAQAKGTVRVVLIEALESDRAREVMSVPEVRARYNELIQRWADDNDVEYITNMRPRAKIHEDDFADWCHIYKPEACRRYVSTLAEIVAAHMPPDGQKDTE